MEYEQLYSKYAPYYDLLYPAEKYDPILSTIEKIYKLYCRDIRSVLDVACGTGTLVGLLAKSGYSASGDYD